MAKSVTTLTIFVSSPGEMKAEREAVVRAVESVNIQLKSSKAIRFEVWDWEKDAIPGVADSAQDVIDQQLPEHDIYLGLMWKRFGSATKMWGSGTEHEFRNSLDGHRKTGIPSHVMFFFRTSIDSLDGLDHVQFAKVGEFKKELGDIGVLHKSFLEVDELERILWIILSKIAGDWEEPKTTHSLSTAIYAEPDNDDELGYLDQLEKSEDSFALGRESAERIGDLLSRLSVAMTEKTRELRESTNVQGNISPRVAKRITNELSADIERFVETAIPVLDEMGQRFEDGANATLAALGFERIMGKKQDPVDFKTMKESTFGLLGVLDNADITFSDFRDIIVGVPNFTLRFNRARRRLIEFIERFHSATAKIRSLSCNILGIAEGFMGRDEHPRDSSGGQDPS